MDSNPLTGLLFCTDHGPGAGGELVFGHDKTARSLDDIERSCSALRPQAGHLIFFDGRERPHYVRPLQGDKDIRVAAVMNYYTDECPESTRPPELNRHLYGESGGRHRATQSRAVPTSYLDRFRSGGRNARTGTAGKGDRVALPW